MTDQLEIGKVVRRSTWSGPCFTRGVLVRETAKFLVVTGQDDEGNARPGERKIGKATGVFHTTPCDRCPERMAYGN